MAIGINRVQFFIAILCIAFVLSTGNTYILCHFSIYFYRSIYNVIICTKGDLNENYVLILRIYLLKKTLKIYVS